VGIGELAVGRWWVVMATEEMFGQLLGLDRAWSVLEARLKSKSSSFVLKVKETKGLCLEESARARTSFICPDYLVPMQWCPLIVSNTEWVMIYASRWLFP